MTLPQLAHPEPGRLVIIGDLDAFTASALEAELRAALEQDATVVLDLSGVGVLTSGGLAVLERCHAHASGRGRSVSMVAREGSLTQRVLDWSAPSTP